MNDDVTGPMRRAMLHRMSQLQLNQLQLAERSGVSAPHLNLFLSGKRTMTVAKINAVCIALGGSLEMGLVLGIEDEIKNDGDRVDDGNSVGRNTFIRRG